MMERNTLITCQISVKTINKLLKRICKLENEFDEDKNISLLIWGSLKSPNQSDNCSDIDYDHEDEYGNSIHLPRRTSGENRRLRFELDWELDLLSKGIQIFDPKTDEGKYLIRLGWKPYNNYNDKDIDGYDEGLDDYIYDDDGERQLRRELTRKLTLISRMMQIFDPKTKEGKYLIRLGWKP